MNKNLRMTGMQLQALRAKHQLTQPQIALLVRKSISPRAKGRQQSTQIGNWENGNKPIPPAMAELLRAKFYLLETGVATFELLVEQSLDEILKDIYS